VPLNFARIQNVPPAGGLAVFVKKLTGGCANALVF